METPNCGKYWRLFIQRFGRRLLPLLPKALAAVGYTIEPGQFVITGSLTGISWVKAPLTVIGEIDGFGSVSVKLSA